MTPATATDRELTLAFQRGEDDAYDVVHDRHVARVAALCRRMLGNEHDAQEATQETFLRVYQALGRFNGRYQLGAWIVRIATNVCLDQLRSRRRHPNDVGGEELLELEPCTSPSGDPEGMSMRLSEGRRVRRVLASMPPMHRAALVLRDFEGFSYAEISVALGISDTQVKALIHRARDRFKRSWTSTGLAAWLPWRIVQRLREPDTLARDQLAQAATSWTPTAASCTAALSSCGHYVSERVGAALAIALVGTAAAASVPTTVPAEQVLRAPEMVLAGETAGEEPSGPSRAPSGKRPALAPADHVSVPESQTGTATVPSAEPAPAPQPTEPAPEPDPSPSETPPPDPEPEPEPSAPPPPPFMPSVTIGGASSIAEPSSHRFGLSCQSMDFSQSLSTVVARGGDWMPASLYVTSGGVNDLVTFEIEVEDRMYRYRSWGSAPVATWTFDANDGASLVISGNYGAEYGSHPEEVGLPPSGAFSVELTLECGSPSVITERVVFQG